VAACPEAYMIGQTWPAERRSFRDPKTGRQIEQLTSVGNNVHLYFTENAFDLRGESIISRSDRASPESRASHERPHYNIFRMDQPDGFGHTRHYSPERGYDTTYTIRDSTILMIPHGFHTTYSAPGYTNYFLWKLAGERRAQAVAFDPAHAWVQKTVGLLKGR
jgi:KduI/IolB family